jgi:hypothetical protein
MLLPHPSYLYRNDQCFIHVDIAACTRLPFSSSVVGMAIVDRDASHLGPILSRQPGGGTRMQSESVNARYIRLLHDGGGGGV